jgi:DNA invertase Pin-like site-specific DNA recombinase
MKPATRPALAACAIYARYSSDLQNEKSIEDQVRVCRERAERDGYPVAQVYSDAALSGAHIVNRPGLQQLLADVQRGRFAVVYAEALDRVSRDQEHAAHVFKALDYIGVKLVTLSEGEIDLMRVGLGSTMAAMWLKGHGEKVRRGLEGKARRGQVAAGLCYGYAKAPTIDAKGEVIRGGRTIDEAQAAIVRRVFAEYLAGKSPRQIALTLNREGVPGPGGPGRLWAPGTISGSAKRKTGLLYQEAYVGRIIFGRSTVKKHPTTGKRMSIYGGARMIVTEAPHLRIVDQATWDAVHARKAALAPVRCFHQKRPARLLAGLVKCEHCGSSFWSRGRTHYECSGTHDRGICDNRKTLRVADLEEAVIGLVEKLCETPKFFARFVAEANVANRKAAGGYDAEIAGLKRQLAKVETSIGNVIASMEEARASRALGARLAELEAQADRLRAEIAAKPRPATLDWHPRMGEYLKLIRPRLREALADPTGEAARLIQEMVLSITVDRTGKTTLHGMLADFIDGAQAALKGDGPRPPRPPRQPRGPAPAWGECMQPPPVAFIPPMGRVAADFRIAL